MQIIDEIRARNGALGATLVVGLLLVAVGCGDDEPEHGHEGDDGASEPLEIAGDWDGEWGPESIGAQVGELWGSTTIIEFDNEARVAIRQNASDAEWDPDKFTRVVWTELDADGGFHYCTVDFGLDSVEEARESETTADPDNLETGCGGFAWSHLFPPGSGA